MSSRFFENISLRAKVETPLLIRPVPRLSRRGVWPIVTDVGRGMRWTRLAQQTNAPRRGRRSRVVLAPRRWREVGDNAYALRSTTVTKKPDRRRERGVSRKAIAQGMPVIWLDLW